MSEEKTASEAISPEDLAAIRQAQSQEVLARAQAEKVVALHKLAEGEVKNTVLTVFNKYSLRAGEDSILENGTIVRKEDILAQQAAVEAANAAAAEELTSSAPEGAE